MKEKINIWINDKESKNNEKAFIKTINELNYLKFQNFYLIPSSKDFFPKQKLKNEQFQFDSLSNLEKV
jgi:hypothetical protein